MLNVRCSLLIAQFFAALPTSIASKHKAQKGQFSSSPGQNEVPAWVRKCILIPALKARSNLAPFLPFKPQQMLPGSRF
jgi:hypothetical protein